MSQVTLANAARYATEQRPRCWECSNAWVEEYVKPEMSRVARASAPEAAVLIDRIPVQAGAPAPLVREWRWWAAKHLQGAYGREAVDGPGAVSEALAAVTAQAAELVPAKADAGRAAAHGGVLTMLDQAHWAAAWLHYLTGRRPRPLAAEEVSAAAGDLAAWLAKVTMPEISETSARRGRELDTATVTRYLTCGVRDWVDDVNRRLRLPALPGLRVLSCYRELRLPVVPPGAVRYGRVDTVAIGLAGMFPDVAVEIDSAPNPSSAAKLSFARDMGAVPIWVRFGSGGTDGPDGVAVIDLRAT